MILIFEKALNWGIKHPRKLFLIDGLGALVSAFLLGVILVQLEGFFGIPKSMLYFLALFPCFFVIYDFYCYQKNSKSTGTGLKTIGFFNLFYCILSVGMAIYHSQNITFFGWSYIALEVMIVVALASIEWKVALRLIS